MDGRNLMIHIKIPKLFIYSLGINPSILLAELIDKETLLYNQGIITIGDFFYYKKEDIFINTGLKRGKIDSSIKHLVKIGIVEIKLGEGKKMFFKINNIKLNKLIFPNSEKEIIRDIFIDLILQKGYIQYPRVFAHKFGINETIILITLVSKYYYYQTEGKLVNDYFFSSNSDLEKDSTLTKFQQNKALELLKSIKLVDVKYSFDNTRYFCINWGLFQEYELIDFNSLKKELNENKIESKKLNEVESGNIDEVESLLINPFLKKELNENKIESKKLNEVESGNIDEVESKKDYTGKQKNNGGESGNININNNKLIITNNNNKQEIKLLLLKNGINEIVSNNIINNYSNERIKEVVKNVIDNNNIKNKSGFIIKALKENWIFDLDGKNIKEKILKKKQEDQEDYLKSKNVLELKNERNKLVNQWIEENKDEYTKIYNEIFKNKENKNLSVKVKEKMTDFEVKNIIYNEKIGTNHGN